MTKQSHFWTDSNEPRRAGLFCLLLCGNVWHLIRYCIVSKDKPSSTNYFDDFQSTSRVLQNSKEQNGTNKCVTTEFLSWPTLPPQRTHDTGNIACVCARHCVTCKPRIQVFENQKLNSHFDPNNVQVCFCLQIESFVTESFFCVCNLLFPSKCWVSHQESRVQLWQSELQ